MKVLKFWYKWPEEDTFPFHELQEKKNKKQGKYSWISGGFYKTPTPNVKFLLW